MRNVPCPCVKSASFVCNNWWANSLCWMSSVRSEYLLPAAAKFMCSNYNGRKYFPWTELLAICLFVSANSTNKASTASISAENNRTRRRVRASLFCPLRPHNPGFVINKETHCRNSFYFSPCVGVTSARLGIEQAQWTDSLGCRFCMKIQDIWMHGYGGNMKGCNICFCGSARGNEIGIDCRKAETSQKPHSLRLINFHRD